MTPTGQVVPILVHPALLPTHLPPPPCLVAADGTLIFPPGFIPPPFPAVTNEEELHQYTAESPESATSSSSRSETPALHQQSSSSSSVSNYCTSVIPASPAPSFAPSVVPLPGLPLPWHSLVMPFQRKMLPVKITPIDSDYDRRRSWRYEQRRPSSGSSAHSSVYGGAFTPTTSEYSHYYPETVSSQDSGRATGGLASSLSPMDEHMVNGNVQDGTLVDDLMDPMPMYEFEIPNSLVGLVIGIKGKTIRELSVRTKVRMLIRQHHTPEKVDTHQICQVRGQREEINHCLQMLRRRFPPARFPELNLQPVLPPPLPNHYFDMIHTQPSWLTLPEEVPCEVAVSNMVDVSQFFLQQPTHPSFASLRHLDLYMLRLYSEHTQIPELPVPCQTGLLCAAPVMNAWFRAVTVNYFEESDEVLIRFVDYGGYARLPRQELRQIRTDLMSLPFQATEVCLAHVKPVDGTLQWDEKAFEEFRSLCMGKVVTAKCIGYAADTKVPMVELYVSNDETDERKVVRFDTHLMELGLARTSDPSKMIRTSLSSMIHKRLSVSSQNSINA
ncbi:unnamed protein product [Caenorhabditis auriculariae]|uniref:Tudor domain-containing protein n=1 Tax=Caenorhabditis auriculariae TaxID=2777116 RepID=A0A8S1H4T8_9PELO|nr:unnamed protein product [Caenorhabditis auriculariae]